MRLIETRMIPIADIELGHRIRAVDEDWAKGLAELIAQTGLQHPIQVLKVGNVVRLVAGAHRLRAHEILGKEEIAASIYEPETANPALELRHHEIVENIGRRELSPLDRAASIAELQRVHKELYGDRRGGDRRAKVQSLHFDFGDEVAAKMGLSRRSVFADIELWNGLSAASRKHVTGTFLADNRAQLRELSKLDHAQQEKALDLILANEPQAWKIADAVAIIENRPRARDGDKRAYAKLQKAWLDAPRKVQKQFLEFLRDIKAHKMIGGE